MRASLFGALTLKDERGQTPVEIAKNRWGKMSRKHFINLKREIYSKNQNTIESYVPTSDTFDNVVNDFGPVVEAVSSLLLQVSNNKQVETANEGGVDLDSSPYGVFDEMKDVSKGGGGWDTSLWRDSDTYEKSWEDERCDVLEVSASFANSAGFSEWFFKNHLIQGQPLVIRQGVSEVARRNFEKDNFVKRCCDV